MSSTWPDSLKTWVTACLHQMNESNKTDAQAELKELIRQSVNNGTMWTKDWSKERLPSLEPKSFKRKNLDSTPLMQTTKKAKKSPLGVNLRPDSDELLNKRARRFEREHEIERQKQAGLLPTHQISRHVNQATNQLRTSALEERMEGLTTSHHSFASRVSGGSSKGSSRRKYLNSSVGYTDEDRGENSQRQGSPDWERYSIVGTSTNTFKNYLRLTSEPDPRDIRPLPILITTLAELKKRWRKEQNYTWACDQFKSLRQDLTVQRIKNEFTVQVYEIHARMALESNDLVEYNQCQSALRHLYELGIPGKSEEFLAYRILYLIHIRNRSDLNRLISSLTPQVKEIGPIKHALEVQRAVANSNYHKLFALFGTAPNMGAYVMDHFVERERLSALCIMTKAYLTLPLAFIAQELAFETPDNAHDFLNANKAALYSSPALGKPTSGSEKTLDCKAAYPILSRTYEEKARKVAIQGAI